MFDRIAGVYDLMNTTMTAGLHHRWRARAADLAGVGPGARVLDVATGTGDLALELARRVAPGGEVLASDFSEGMLDRARAKAERSDAAVRPRFEWADAMELPYPEGSFDAATVGFGARNFEDLDRGLAEMARVVRPGGRVVVLEITNPTRAPLSHFYRLWFDRAVPAIGRLAGALGRLAGALGGLAGALGGSAALRGSRPAHAGAVAENGETGAGIGAAYSYLPSSVKRFPSPEALAEAMQRAGLREIRYLLTAGGIVAIHAGTVQGESG
jgi:demethylmenaquinone methyltransferase / 2-methoxy-6-polyprenyl-1,4-benzoquinol methylase